MKAPDANDTLRNEGEEALRQQNDSAQKFNGGATPLRFRLIPFDELRPTDEVAYLIKDVLPASGIGIWWGGPKCLKSFLALDASIHISMGWRFRGHRVHQGPVVYCAFEGANGFPKRVEAFRRTHEVHGHVPFFLMPIHNAKLVRDHQQMIRDIKAQNANPVLIVLDTLNRSIDGSESKDEDMSAYLGAADAISQAFGCLVLIIHHCGIAGDRPRGHSSQTGTCDVQGAVTRQGNDVRLLIEHMKDGPSGAEFVSCMEQVEVGTDQDGDPMTSCALVPVEAPGAGPTIVAKSKKDITWEKSLLRRVLMKVAAKDGVNMRPIEDGPDVRVIDQELVRAEFYQSMAADGDAETKQGTRRKAFGRAIKNAQQEGKIGVREIDGVTLLWLWTEPPDPSAYWVKPPDAGTRLHKYAECANGFERVGTHLAGGLELVGAEPPETTCAHCGSAEGNVLLIRKGVQSQPLHEDCAPKWFEAQ
jgi:hypothetical protein